MIVCAHPWAFKCKRTSGTHTYIYEYMVQSNGSTSAQQSSVHAVFACFQPLGPAIVHTQIKPTTTSDAAVPAAPPVAPHLPPLVQRLVLELLVPHAVERQPAQDGHQGLWTYVQCLGVCACVLVLWTDPTERSCAHNSHLEAQHGGHVVPRGGIARLVRRHGVQLLLGLHACALVCGCFERDVNAVLSRPNKPNIPKSQRWKSTRT